MHTPIAPEGEIYNAVTIGRIDVVSQILDRVPAKLDTVGPLGRTPLHKAAQCGHFEIVRLLVAKGANLQAQDSSVQTPLYLAAHRGREEVVDFLWTSIESSKDDEDKNGNTLLHAAVEGGLTRFVKQLLAANFDVNHPNREGVTPVFMAAAKGDATIVETLLLNGARLGVSTTKKQTLLHAATSGGLAPLVTRLLADGGDAHVADSAGETPLVLAARFGRHNVVQLLVDHGCRLDDVASSSKDTLILAACAGGCDSVLRRLLESRNSPADRRRMPIALMLKEAASHGRLNIIQTLAEMDLCSKNVVMTYDFFRYGHDSTEIVKLLCWAGADVNGRDGNGDRPVDHASFNGNQDLLEFLTAGGATLDGRALIKAVWGNNPKIVRFLIGTGVSPNSPGDGGETALAVAVQVGSPEMVDLLMELGGSVNQADDAGFTPLHRAVASGRSDVVSSLISAGAQVVSTNVEGFQPLHGLPIGSELTFGTYDEWHKFDAGALCSILELLISRGAVCDSYVAAGLGDHNFVCEHVAKQPERLNATLYSSGTMLHWATCGGYKNVVDVLIAAGIDVNGIDASGRSALHIAASLGRDVVVARLIEAGADVCLNDHRGDSALDVAIRCCQADIVKLLVAHGAVQKPTVKRFATFVPGST